MSRIYDKNDPQDRAWRSKVYQTALVEVRGLLPTVNRAVPLSEICQIIKNKHPNLCNDDIKDPKYPSRPLWKHAVSNALHTLKNKDIQRSNGGWTWRGRFPAGPVGVIKPSSPAPEPVTPQPPPASGVETEAGQVTDISQRLLARLQSLSPRQFEHFVGEFLKAKGITDVKVTPHSNDDGIDAIGKIPFVNIKVAVQAKRYASGSNVGIEPVQRLRGSMASGFDRGIFITTSTFSAAASGWVEETGVPITLVDGNHLVNEMIDLELGVRTIPV